MHLAKLTDGLPSEYPYSQLTVVSMDCSAVLVPQLLSVVALVCRVARSSTAPGPFSESRLAG